MKGESRQQSQVYYSKMFTGKGSKRMVSNSGRARNLALTNAQTHQGYTLESGPQLGEIYSGTGASLVDKGHSSGADTASGVYSTGSRKRLTQVHQGFPVRRPIQTKNLRMKIRQSATRHPTLLSAEANMMS